MWNIEHDVDNPSLLHSRCLGSSRNALRDEPKRQLRRRLGEP